MSAIATAILALLLAVGVADAQSTSSTEPNRSEDTTTGRVVPSREGSKSSSTTVEQNQRAKQARQTRGQRPPTSPTRTGTDVRDRRTSSGSADSLSGSAHPGR
jgi:hypothetical protein